MRVEGVGDVRGEEVARIGRAQTQHVEIELVEIDAVLAHDRRNELLALRMMDELWLQRVEDRRHLFRGHVFVDITRVVRGEDALQHRLGKADEGASSPSR